MGTAEKAAYRQWDELVFRSARDAWTHGESGCGCECSNRRAGGKERDKVAGREKVMAPADVECRSMKSNHSQ